MEEKGKVLLPEKAKMYPDKGEVIAVGPGDAYGYPEFIPCMVKAGDKVYFSRDRAYKLDTKAGKRYCIKERDVLAIIEGEDDE